MHKIKNISIIGSGNVAFHLGKNLFDAGLIIDSVFSRNIKHSQKLAGIINAAPVDDLAKLPDDSDLYLIAISDNAIASVGNKLNKVFGRKPDIVHTSGMVSSKVFSEYFDNYGVFYPLQTFTKDRKIDIEEVPFFITANAQYFRNKLIDLAKKISSNVKLISDDERKTLHVAAIFANNFTNYMYSITKDILDKESLDFNLLYPLIKETANKIMDDFDPSKIQTGPAKRKDHITIQKHLEFLEKYPEYKEVYRFLTEKLLK